MKTIEYILAVTTLFSISCVKSPTSDFTPTTINFAIPSIKKPTVEQARRFGEELEKNLRDNGPAYLYSYYNAKIQTARGLNGIEVRSLEASELIEKMKDSIEFERGRVLLSRIEDGANQFDFLRVRSRSREVCVLFRFSNGPMVDYYEFVLRRGPANTLEIIDVYDYSFSELYSRYINRTSRTLLEFQRANTKKGGVSAEAQHYFSIGKALVERNHLELERLLDDTPHNSYVEKVLLINLLRITCHNEELKPLCISTFDRYNANYKDDAARPFLAYPYHQQIGAYDDAMAAIDTMDSILIDPYLDYVKAYVSHDRGDLEKARALAYKCILRDPSIYAGWNMLINLAIEEENYEAAIVILHAMSDSFDVHPRDFIGKPAFAAFVESPAFQEWQAPYKKTGQLDKSAVLDEINSHTHEIQACYEKELLHHPTLAGRIMYDFTISTSGTVKGVNLRSTTLNSPAAETCIAEVLSRMHFPAPKGGEVQISYPFLFRAIQ